MIRLEGIVGANLLPADIAKGVVGERAARMNAAADLIERSVVIMRSSSIAALWQRKSTHGAFKQAAR
jgi:hypothetical protein